MIVGVFIESLLSEEGQEDKHQNFSTTSFQFKRDIWEFFTSEPDAQKWSCVEFGTHKGQTTRILSFLFEQVYTINLPGHFDSAKVFNADRSNIQYVEHDLYSGGSLAINRVIDVFFIDANHEYNNVMMDVDTVKSLLRCPEAYVIFDDYGGHIGVNIAVNDLVENGDLEIVKFIGHRKGHSFGGNPERILKDWEGVICKIKK
jgi:hypothetical protein